MLRILAILSLVSSPVFASQKVSVDTAATKVEWVGAKIASSHNGLVPVKEGSLTVDKGEIKAGTITVDVANMTNSDLSGEYQTKLLNHLKSDDFFSTAKHPTAKIDVKSAKKLSGKQYEFTGDLTIKGVTKPTTFKADVEDVKGNLQAKGSLVFDRTAFGIQYNSGKFFQSLGDKLIKDEVTLNFTLVTKK